MDSEAIKDLLTNVTRGPWAWEENHPTNACANVTAKDGAGWNINIATLYGDSDDVPTPTAPDEPWGDHPIRRADARFIAAARDLVPALLAERDAALADVARLSHALAAETAKREAMEAAGNALAEQAAHVCIGASIPYMDINASAQNLGPLVDAWNATLAKHGSKT